MKWRERLSRMWRWPLYSRARALCTAAAILTTAVIWSNLTKEPEVAPAGPPPPGITAGAGSPTAATGPTTTTGPKTSWISSSPTTGSETTSPVRVPDQPRSDVSGELEASGGTTTDSPGAAPGTSGVSAEEEQFTTEVEPTELQTVPAVPRLTSDQADYQTPAAAASAYLSVWCYQPADQPANTNIATAAAWMTAAGWEDDKARAVTDTEWAQTQQAGISTLCGPVSVADMLAAPSSDTMQWVEIRSQQVRVDAAGGIVGQSSIVQTRRILQHTDGRWLVDVQVQAG